MKDDKPDLEVIVGAAKKDPAYAKMTGKKAMPDDDEEPDAEGDESEEEKQERYLSEAFDAYKAGDKDGFIAAMTAWRTDCKPMT